MELALGMFELLVDDIGDLITGEQPILGEYLSEEFKIELCFIGHVPCFGECAFECGEDRS